MSGQFEGAGVQFEIMPFGAGGSRYEAQMEEEREEEREEEWEEEGEEERAGRRGGSGGGGRDGGRGGGGRAAPKMRVRPQGKPPVRGRYGRPAPWPVFPAVEWPRPRWDEPPSAPDAGEPYAEPADEPFDDGAEGEVTAAERAVLMRFPPELRTVLLKLPDAARPRYVSLGMLPQAARNPAAARAGLYLIVFTIGGRKHAYNGQSRENVRGRLQKHLLGATLLGFRPLLNNHEVFFAQAPGNARPRDIELAINKRMLKPHRGVLTNQRHELEAELLGEAWL